MNYFLNTARQKAGLILGSILVIICLIIHPGLVRADFSVVPNTNTTSGVNGFISALRVASDKSVYIGGTFSRVGSVFSAGSGIPISISSKDIVSTYPKVSSDGQTVKIVISDNHGGWYIGGNFNAVGTSSRANLAHILANGSVDPHFDPELDNAVSALALSPDEKTLYVAGDFSHVNTATTPLARAGVAAFNTNTGVATAWDPEPDNKVSAIVVSPNNATVYLGGSFGSININTAPVSVANLAAVDAATGIATSWNPGILGNVPALTISSDGATIYAGGDFTVVNTNTSPVTRSNLAAFNTTTGIATAWDPEVDGAVDIITLSPDGSIMYVNGDFKNVNTATSSLPRNWLAAFDTNTGVATAWDPEPMNRASNNYDPVAGIVISPDDTTVYLAGQFKTMNATGASPSRDDLAAVNTTDGTVTPWQPSCSYSDGSLYTIAISSDGSTIYTGGDAVTIGIKNDVIRNNLAHILANGSVDPHFDPELDNAVSALALSPDEKTVYAVGSFGSVNIQTSPITRNGAAAFSVVDGSVDPHFDPELDDNGQSIVLSPNGDLAYIGGGFKNVNTKAASVKRTGLAAFNTTTGIATAWDPEVDGTTQALALSPNTNTIYVGGSFSGVGASLTQRNNLAAFNTTTGMVTSWDPETDGSIQVLALSPNGDTVYTGGSFANVNTNTSSVKRKNLAAFSTNTGVATAWDPEPNGSTVLGLAIPEDDSAVYVAGLFDQLNMTTTAVKRSYLGALNPLTGMVTSWDPEPNNPVAALEVAPDNSSLYTGGVFQYFFGKYTAESLAIFPVIIPTTSIQPILAHVGVSEGVTYICTDPKATNYQSSFGVSNPSTCIYRTGNTTPSISTQAPVSQSPKFHFTRTLKYGMKGNDVIKLQEFLKITPSSVKFFGPKTKTALKLFQKLHQLTPDGVAGPKTEKLIESLM